MLLSRKSGGVVSMHDSRSSTKSRHRASCKTAGSLSEACRSPDSKAVHRRASSSVVERLQAQRHGERLTKDSILQELLPNQKCVLLAKPLVHFHLKSASTPGVVEGSVARYVSRHVRSPRSPTSPSRKLRHRLLNPLVIDSDSPSTPSQCAIADYCEYTMKIWEDKVARHMLSIKDAVYLLVHEETMRIVESALLLKISGMDFAQMMEVEVTLDQLSGQLLHSSIDLPDTSRCWHLPHYQRTVSQALFENVWMFGVAFHTEDKSSLLPEAQLLGPLKISSPKLMLSALVAAREQQSPASKARTIECNANQTLSKNNQQEMVRIRRDLHSSCEELHRHGENVIRSSEWIQEHCVEEIRQRKSPLFRAALRNQAAVLLMNIIARRVAAIQRKRLSSWFTRVQEGRCRDAVHRYCQLKSASKVLALARRHLRYSMFLYWQRWKQRQVIERKMERLASAVVIQSWARRILAKRRVKTYHLDRAATLLQAKWRGYFCRKLLTRRRRYAAYTASASIVQRAFRAYHNRCQFAIHWRRHKASCCITRNLRRCCARRRLLKAWSRRVAQFHSAAVIQMWMRKTLQRIRADRVFKAQQASSAMTLQRFFRYARFLLTFTSRVKRVALKRNAAAVTLQNAYRAKIARARFYALKDQLEAQRRQEFLKLMWDNAYATTIQRSWRKKRLRRWKLAQQAAKDRDGAM